MSFSIPRYRPICARLSRLGGSVKEWSRKPTSETSPTAPTWDEEASSTHLSDADLPPKKPFDSSLAEVGFCFAVCGSQALAEYLLTGAGQIFNSVAEDFHSSTTSMAWASCIHSVIVASATLPFARAADIHGGYPVFIFGMIWILVWTIVAGFCKNTVIFAICRAMHGFALAAIQPASLAMIGAIYKAGRRRNIVLGIFGACAPFGFFAGVASGTLSANFHRWQWYFWTAALLSFVVILATILTSPQACRDPLPCKIGMDWWGSFTIFSGLLLITYSLSTGSDYSHGYFSWHTLVPLGIGLLLLCISVYIELKVAASPLLPKRFFANPSTIPFILACLFFYGAFGIFLFYATFYLQTIAATPPLTLLLYFTPLGLVGILISLLAGLIMHRIPLTLLLLFSGLAWILTPLLFAFVTPTASYWPLVFPAMVCAALGLDLTFTISTVFLTSSQPLEFQGVAGAVCSSLVNLAIAFSLGLAHVVFSQVGGGQLGAYRAVFWLATASAGVGFAVCVVAVRIPRAAGQVGMGKVEVEVEVDSGMGEEGGSEGMGAGEEGKEIGV
ncbi:MFS general substrate transporter [Mytilinidion resinicola]|uniref:MFS general substrate transporter n=1 Tax=Mytilinidion resinicola TaxID=574789 RepID=A0A6A6YXF9_9PEZI|nr:MFS general substrate transporter [Mytilinidion resinicola]KAF2812607.1 MFS general substrate transporter [Mytilinidion resinicola]